MKVKLWVLLLSVFLLVGCRDTSDIAVQDYAGMYYDIINSFETRMAETVYNEAADMINTQLYLTDYSHPDFKHFISETVTEMDDMLYGLSLLGPQLTDDTLMKYQSKLEFALFDLMNVFKDFQNQDIFMTNVPNRYTLYNDVYVLLNDLSEDMYKYQTLTLEIEKYLKHSGYEASHDYYQLKHTNVIRYNYWHAILSSQVSTYQDYTGLRAQPQNTSYVVLKNDYMSHAPEMDTGIMISTCKSIKNQLSLLDQYVTELNMDPYTNYASLDYLLNYIKTYGVYVQYRTELPYDFFKSGEFSEYQLVTDREFPGFDAYYFDEKYNEDYHFNIIEVTHSKIHKAMRLQPHINYMRY